jgi:hypothetical protein
LTESLAQPGNAAAFPAVGRWSVTAIPSGWIYGADFGIRQMPMGLGAVTASVGVGQDKLSADSGLLEYIEKQKKLIGGHLQDVNFAGPQASPFPGAEESHLLFVRHNVASAGIMLHAQTYVRLADWVGIITLTTLELQLRGVRPDYEAFVKGLRIGTE